MADKFSNEGSSSSNVCGESSDSVVELNIKTLDSQIYTFQVDKKMPVSLFKEKIANEIGVPVGQQRLIFRGKVLKDDHLLSEYHVESGHTLHLVARQQSQPSSDTSSGETNVTDGNRGNDTNTGAPRNRVGQISHSVVLGTFNVGDQGEGIVPDLSRVIGAVLNSFGVGNQPATNGMQTATLSNASGQAPQGNESDGIRGSVGSQIQAGNQTHPGQAFPGHPFQSSPQVVQIPLTAVAAVPVPSIHVPIPDSLNTLSEFMSHMVQTLSQNGYQPDSSSASTRDLPGVELPTNAQRLPTPEALSIVMRHAHRLISDHAIVALSHIAGRLEREGASSDPAIRGQIQAESVQVGIAMQHLGALMLELGRTILTLRMGQSPAESSVNSGPAVYISSSGPNPIMVQPFPLQTSSLFGGAVPPSNPTTFGPVGMGSAPRHINIHIHAGTSLGPIVSAVGSRSSNGNGTQGERSNNTGSGGSGPMRVLPVGNVIAAAVPSRSTGVAVSSAAQPGQGHPASQPPPDSVSLSSVIAEVNSRIRDFVGNMQGENQVASGRVESTVQGSSLGSGAGNGVRNEQPNNIAVSGAEEPCNSLRRVPHEGDGPKPKPECNKGGSNEDIGSAFSSKDVSTSSVGGSLSCSSGESTVKSEDASKNSPRSSERHDIPEGARAVPLGLGLGGTLERKKRSTQPKSVVKSGDNGTTSASRNQNLNAGTSAQQLLQSLASRSSAMNMTGADDPPSNQFPHVTTRIMESREEGGQGSDDQLDAASAMSQVLQSPALDGLLAGISGQTGVGSPNVMRNMFQQFIQSPQIMNTVHQIAQQVDSQGLENMFSGLGGGQGGGIDLSRMVQQMMPAVSRALTHGSTASQSFPSVEPETHQQYEERTSEADKPDDRGFQINTHQVAQMIEHFNTPGDVFHAVVENAVRLHGDGSSRDDLVDELCSDEGLAAEYTKMLRHDLSRRLHDDSGHDKC